MSSFVLTESQAKHQIKNFNKTFEGLKTWEQQYGQVDVAAQKQASALTYDYAKAVGDAYASAYENQQAILSSNVGKGYKEQAIQSNDDVLQEAYNAYLQNYQKGLANVEESASEATSQITKNLETEAANTKLMQESAYKYLQYLYKNYSNSPMFQEELWKRYLTTENDVTRLKTWEELSPELYDAEGNLNITGADFYDQMMNQISQGTYGDTSKYGQITDYYSWLRSENPDLYDWAKSYNPYDYSMYYDPTTGEFVNSKEGSFKTMVGLTSSDQTYSFIERYGGMSEKDITNMFSKYQSKINKAMSNNDHYKARSSINEMQLVSEELKDMAKEFGIYEELNKEIGGFDNLAAKVNNYISSTTTKGEAWKKGGLRVASDTALFAGLGNKLVPGGAGALFGLTIGLLTGIVRAGLQATGDVVKNVEAQENAYNMYTKAISTMTQYVLEQRRQKELEYNKR